MIIYKVCRSVKKNEKKKLQPRKGAVKAYRDI